VSDEASWIALVEETADRFGPVSVLANNAGLLRFGEIATASLEEVELMWRVNQMGVFLGMRAVVPTMKAHRAGSIINASSVEGLAGMAGCTAYAATKWAIRGMTKCAAMELAADGIRVNSVHPGGIDTPMVRHFIPDEDSMTWMGKQVPMKRPGKPEEVAEAVAFLLGPAGRGVTGAPLVLDLGWTAR
jgi:3alpha(or 20beta)-hydroxysteroid dehydrogenase